VRKIKTQTTELQTFGVVPIMDKTIIFQMFTTIELSTKEMEHLTDVEVIWVCM